MRWARSRRRLLLCRIHAAHFRLEGFALWIRPGPGDLVFECEGLAERIFQDLVQDERPQTPDRIHGDEDDRGNAVAHRRLYDRAQILRLVHQIYPAFHGHFGRRPAHAEILRGHRTVGDVHGTLHQIEGKPAAEKLAEIEREPGLHADDADEPCRTGLRFQQL